MCTLSLIPQGENLCITMNRDEYRSRDEAGVFQGDANKLQYCYPVDGQARGTWAGINSHGVTLCLLNRYQATHINAAISRGAIIPDALQQGGFDAVLAFMRNLTTAHFNGFDCVLSARQGCVNFSWDGIHYREKTLTIHNGIMMTSSAERLEEVSAYRHQQFQHWLNNADLSDSSTFHLQQAEHQAANAVFMSRELTHTKSIVCFTLKPSHCDFDYYENAGLLANHTFSAATPSLSWSSPIHSSQ